jgi:hypothetical protein
MPSRTWDHLLSRKWVSQLSDSSRREWTHFSSLAKAMSGLCLWTAFAVFLPTVWGLDAPERSYGWATIWAGSTYDGVVMEKSDITLRVLGDAAWTTSVRDSLEAERASIVSLVYEAAIETKEHR